MIRLKEDTRKKLMIAHGLAMIGLGLGLLYIRTAMTVFLYYFFGFAVALLLVAASLLFTAAVDWMCAAGMGSRQISTLRGLLFLSTIAAAVSVFLMFYPGTTISILCYVIGAYALLLGIGKFRFAMHWKGGPAAQLVMYILAIVALLFSIFLVYAARQDERDALGVIGVYTLFIGVQMLCLIFYFARRMESARAASGARQAHL